MKRQAGKEWRKGEGKKGEWEGRKGQREGE